MKLPDLLVAALADQHGLGVLHYDTDFDTLAGHTTLTFRSRWIAERGSVDEVRALWVHITSISGH